MEIGHAIVVADAAKLTEGDWQELRHKSIGSSDAAGIMSMGRYGSPYKTWEVKTGKRVIKQNFLMQLGHVMEPLILSLAAEELGLEVVKPDLVLAHPDHPLLTCNLDGLGLHPLDKPVIVEAKHAGSYLKKELRAWQDTGEVEEGTATEGWWVQVQFQMLVTGLERAHLAALCDKDFFLIPISANPSIQDTMVGMLPGWFETHVTADIEPAVGGRDGDVVAERFPLGHEEEIVNMDAVMDDIVLARKFKDEIKSLKRELAELDVRIKNHLGAGGTGVFDGEQVINSYSMERKAVDYRVLFTEHPEIYYKVVSTKTSRQYRY